MKRTLSQIHLSIFVLLTAVFIGAAGLKAEAFLYEVPILDRPAILKLSDEQLIDRYIDVMVELDASRTFHEASGFNPADYRKYKAIIRYRIYLQMELEKRELRVPGMGSQVIKMPEEIPAEDKQDLKGKAVDKKVREERKLK